MTKGPAKPGLSNAARLLLLRRLVFAGLATLLGILLPRLLILLARLLILARLLVLLRISGSNCDIGHRIIFHISVQKYFRTDN
jgi:hypothetical protein